MEPAKKQITGYRTLSDKEIELINRIKAKGAELGELMDSIMDVDPLWLATAKTDLQKGFMSLVRAITKPGGF